MFHELREAELIYSDKIIESDAHKESEIETGLYAKKYLSEEGFKKYSEWEKNVRDNNKEKESKK